MEDTIPLHIISIHHLHACQKHTVAWGQFTGKNWFSLLSCYNHHWYTRVSSIHKDRDMDRQTEKFSWKSWGSFEDLRAAMAAMSVEDALAYLKSMSTTTGDDVFTHISEIVRSVRKPQGVFFFSLSPSPLPTDPPTHFWTHVFLLQVLLWKPHCSWTPTYRPLCAQDDFLQMKMPQSL